MVVAVVVVRGRAPSVDGTLVELEGHLAVMAWTILAQLILGFFILRTKII